MTLRASIGSLLGLSLALAAMPQPASAQPAERAGQFDASVERDFVDGMTSYAARDYRRAEAMFRRILDRDPRLLRVRLELARTLFMEKKDEQAD